MGKKKRGHPDVEEILARPWCYYCERDFDDLKILTSHQKAKHFKCERCGRRLNTAGGLSVHMNQVHKEMLSNVENALPNRSGLDVEIFGMEGIPEDAVASHNQRVLQQFYEAEAQRRTLTVISGPGAITQNVTQKKPKLESPSDLKKRLAEHKAKKASQEVIGVSSGDVPPMGAAQGGQSPNIGQTSVSFPSVVSPYLPQASSFAGSQGSSPPTYQQSYGQPSYTPASGLPAFSQSASFNPPNFTKPSQPSYGSPNGPYSPASGAPFTQASQPIPPGSSPASGAQFHGASYQGGPSRQFGAGSPSITFHSSPHQALQGDVQPSNGQLPQRQSSLPSAPGLPQRPAFGTPHVNQFQLQQMHQGNKSTPPNSQAKPDSSIAATTVDDLVSSVAKDAASSFCVAGETREKRGKKENDKNARLVYSDNIVSPEEKMARLPRYAFVPDKKEEMMDTVESPMMGVVSGLDDVTNQGRS